MSTLPHACAVAVLAAGEVAAHQNNFYDAIGVDTLGVATIDATLNWWKCCRGGE